MTWLWCALAAVITIGGFLTLINSRAYRIWQCRRFGFCPQCDSSPPRPHCPVCHGTSAYGPQMTPQKREAWITRYRALP